MIGPPRAPGAALINRIACRPGEPPPPCAGAHRLRSRLSVAVYRNRAGTCRAPYDTLMGPGSMRVWRVRYRLLRRVFP
jgi:hypothetical protein